MVYTTFPYRQPFLHKQICDLVQMWLSALKTSIPICCILKPAISCPTLGTVTMVSAVRCRIRKHQIEGLFPGSMIYSQESKRDRLWEHVCIVKILIIFLKILTLGNLFFENNFKRCLFALHMILGFHSFFSNKNILAGFSHVPLLRKSYCEE